MKLNKNKVGGILLLIGIVAVLFLTFNTKKHIQHSNTNSTENIVENKNILVETHKDSSINIGEPQIVKNTNSKQQAIVPTQAQWGEGFSAYLATRQSGIIGAFGGIESDNPIDNIFTVSIDKVLQASDRVWLNFKLEGVTDFNGIACSVNDRLSFGGYLVKKDTAVRRQKLRINAAWLKKGNNRIQFGLASNAKYGYKISDLAIEVQSNSDNTPELIVNTTKKLYNGKSYLHGFVTNSKHATVEIDGKKLELRDGEFEYMFAGDTITKLIANVGDRKIERTIILSQDIEPDYEFALNNDIERKGANFKKANDNRLELGIVLIKAPKNVVLNDTKITSTSLRCIDLPALNIGMTNVTSQKRGVRFLPHGNHFGGDGASVALKYDRTLIPDGYTENDIRTFYFDINVNQWVALERDTVNKELCMVVSKTTHFTDMINGVITTPESPETQGFAPTMMNDIKAADPTAKIQLIAPPTANNQGSANLSYPIEILPVRGSINPNLAITYNSDGGNGWLGEGWNLNLPVIAVDTRWGVPRYDTKYETETYSLNGVMLATVVDYNNQGVVSVGRKGVMYQRLVVDNGASPVQFHPVSESDFALILRYGNSPSNYYWKITNKAGITYTYGTITGEPENAVLKGSVNSFEHNASNVNANKLLATKNAIAEWHLSKIEDQYKNYCKIKYNVLENAVANSQLKTKEIVPELITIGFVNEDKDTILQTIKFNIRSKKKNKITNSGRYGFITCSNTLLESIEVKDKSANLVRKYKAQYNDAGEFGANLLAQLQVFYGTESVAAASHVFDYHNNLVGGSNQLFHDNTEVWQVPTHNWLQDLPALGGSKSTNHSGSLYLGAGVGIGKVGAEVGYNYSNSTVNTNTAAMLIDITGDGLPDKLFRQADGNVVYLYYSINYGNGNFSDPINTFFTENITSTKVKSDVHGWKGTIGVKFNENASAQISAGRNWLNSTNNTGSYFSDVNNDGLVDIVHNGVVYFNYISKFENGKPIHAFSTNSGYSPSPIINAKTIKRNGRPIKVSDNVNLTPTPNTLIIDEFNFTRSDAPIQRDNDSILAEKRLEYANIPMQDIVRVWEAPYGGQINIGTEVKMIATSNSEEADGVRVAIQHKGVEIWSRIIQKGNFDLITSSNTISVMPGDKVFFRVQSGNTEFADALGDVVVWNPIITYTQRSHTIDINGYNDAVYKPAEGAFVNKLGYNLIDSIETTTVSLKGKLTRPRLSNAIKLNVYLSNDSLLINETVKDSVVIVGDRIDTVQVVKKFEYQNPNYQPEKLVFERLIHAYMDLTDHDVLGQIQSLVGVNHYRFEIFSESNVAWDKIQWKPEIHCRMNGVDTVIYAGVKYGSYSKQLQFGQSGYLEVDDCHAIDNKVHVYLTSHPSNNCKFNLEIINSLQTNYFKGEIIDGAAYFNTENVIYFLSNDLVTANLYIEGNEVFNGQATIELYRSSTSYENFYQHCEEIPPLQSVIFANVYRKRTNAELDFGHMWRGWGQFQYNANDGRYALPIEENKLYIPADTALAKISNEWGVKNMRMFTVNPESTQKRYWTGLNEHLFIISDTISVGRLNMAEMPNILAASSVGGPNRILPPTYSEGIPPQVPTDNSINGDLYTINTAPTLSSKQSTTTWWGGASASIGKANIGASLSGSEGTSVVTSAFMDMNGDGYPDYITDTQIEYTNRHGGRDGEIAGYHKINNNTEWRASAGNVGNILTKNETSNSFSVGLGGGASISVGVGVIKLPNSTTITNGGVEFATSSLAKEKSLGGNRDASFSINHSNTTNTYVDVNGDGLPDRVFVDNNTVYVCLNLGYSFSTPTKYGLHTVDYISAFESRSYGFDHGTSAGVRSIFQEISDLIFYDKKASAIVQRTTEKLLEKGIGISFSLNGARTTTYSLHELRDVNMDGLPDMIYRAKDGTKDCVAIAFNKGDSFTNPITLKDIEKFFKLVSNAVSSNLHVNINIRIGWFRFTVGGGGSLGHSWEYATTELIDIDGDGFPDLLEANELNKSEVKVRRSKIGYTNKLKSVSNPLGGVIAIDYARSKATFDHPGGKWVMKTVDMYDGVSDDGEDPEDGLTMKNKYEYGSARYDRYEREFLGFGELVSYNYQSENKVWKPYRAAKQVFLTDNIYHKGMLSKSEVYDLTANTQRINVENISKNYDYSVKRIATKDASTEGKYKLETVNLSRFNMFNNQYIIYSPQKYTKNIHYANHAQNGWVGITTAETYSEYNTNVGTHGEMIMYKYSDKGGLGEGGTGVHNYRVVMTYLDSTNMTLFSLPKSHIVYDGNKPTDVLRKIEYYWWADYASQLKAVVNYTDTSKQAITGFEYDRYGNIYRKRLPVDANGERQRFTYQYDPVYRMFPTKITDAHGYTYQMLDYDYRFGIPLKTIDINGNVMTQTVDNRGRIETIKGPNEHASGAPYTIKFEYNPQKIVKNAQGVYAQMPYAITKHWDATKATSSKEEDKYLETVTFVDGFGRPIQVKKESVVDGVNKMIVSGRAKFDAFGRVTEAYYPLVGEMTNKTMFDNRFNLSVPPTSTTYDVLDRVTSTKLPDGATTSMHYSIAEGMLLTRVTDANGKYQDTYSTGDGKTVKTVQYKAYDNSEESKLITRFEYDAINQLVKVIDAADQTTASEYDLAGRRTKLTHPASGVTTFGYDAASNLLWKFTANNDSIKYGYKYNRLERIEYPRYPENNVTYTFGDDTPDNRSNNRVGRLVSLEDGSGAQAFKYGKQGEVTEVRRTLVIPNQAVATYVTKTTYDSWNRLLSMTYPDGEVVNYSYNVGGLLTGIVGNKPGEEATVYVKNVKYDEFEQRTSLQYGNGLQGNGSITTYSYDPKNRQLQNLIVSSNGKGIMNNTYNYDKVGNIERIENIGEEMNAANTISGKIGGKITHNYHYDNLYRLDSASGVFNQGAATYNLKMQYDNMHNITSKNQHISQSNVQFGGTLNAGYMLKYTINGNNSQQISNIADENYRYVGDKLAAPPAEALKKQTQEYAYDANGNLISIQTGTKTTDEQLQVTKSRRLLWDEENRLLGISDNGFVSQYWYDASGERTVKESFDNEGVYINGALGGARTGTSKFTAYVSPYLVVSNGGNYTKHVYMGSQRITSKVSNSGIFGTTSPVNDTLQAKYKQQTTKIKERFDSLGVAYSGLEQSGGLVSLSPPAGDIGGCYFYHPDHLGSSSLITDATGALVQHIQYVPFGEVFIEQRNNKWSTPYKFNGKELDEETGLAYYHARYYDPRTSVWLSVDPLAEKMPNVSSYVYCFNNPVKFIDPDGASPVGAILEGVGAFVITAGIDFISNWVFSDMDYQQSFNNISWGAASLDALSTAALSFFIDGTGSAKYISKIGNSKGAKMLLDIFKNMNISITAQIEKGANFKEIDFTKEFLVATFTTLLSNGLSKKADELLESLKDSNKNLFNQLNKLKNNSESGKNEARLKSDTNKVQIAKTNSKSNAVKYSNEKSKIKIYSDGAAESGKKMYEMYDKK